ncbi:PP2C family protein-serine/threonine phosphatase [Nonomuraea gerenzanensis]|uniref:PP2C family protein-serine/threonine phosphatase n=1 Tax=Nonomuraea gerenzanensis TaxID=93944 RepID=UPI001CD9895E|nr:GAF domain-containing SpoIIE family protein phosphatase [Nonomuraea gerenzanensis]UBU13314.1 SpoIIE family protein phosphatase [Nonomuraea gerenzanensis]
MGGEPQEGAFDGFLGRLGAEDLQRLQESLGQIRDLHDRMKHLLEAVLAISSELELNAALRTIVEVSADLVDARYGALGVLDEDGQFADLFTCGVSQEVYDAIGRMPTTHGLLGELVAHPRPMRVDDLQAHPAFREFPAGHPVMRTLLGTPVLVRGTVYGNMYFADKRTGGPFTGDDERIIAALASAAGVAIENARLYDRLRRSTEDFQRSLLPDLPDMPDPSGLHACARYRPSSSLPKIGGDWYDVIILPDGVPCLMVGDVMGHDLKSATIMSRISTMLRVITYEQCEPPSYILRRLDEVLHGLHGGPMATVLLGRLEPCPGSGRRLCWSSAGHPPPLLVPADGPAHYLRADGGHPLGVTTDLSRPDHAQLIPVGSTLLLYTDGLVEDPAHSLDDGLDSLAHRASDLRHLPLEEMCDQLLRHRGDHFTDDVALLALRIGPCAPVMSAG